MEFFKLLGDEIECRWLKSDYDTVAFSEIAESALLASPPAAAVSHGQIAEWVLSDDFRALRPLRESPFGQPDVALYVSPSGRFHIEALFWLSSTTTIHQHAFSGAFHVLAGSSVHGRYRFVADRVVNERFQIGRVELQEIDHLTRGQTRPILAGSNLIHALFHLDSPSVTIVVRTSTEQAAGIQFNYYLPSVALAPPDSRNQDIRVTKRKGILDVLCAEATGDVTPVVVDLLGRSDLEATFQLLTHAADLIRFAPSGKPSPIRLGPCLAKAEERHGPVVNRFLPVIQYKLRSLHLIDARRRVRNPELRLFMGVLLNAPSADALARVITRIYPDRSPRETLGSWLEMAWRDAGSALDVDLDETFIRLAPELLLDPASAVGTEDADRKRVLERMQRSNIFVTLLRSTKPMS